MEKSVPTVQTYTGNYKVPSLDGIRGKLRVEGPSGSLTVAIDDGSVTITPEHDGADCVLTAYEVGDLDEIITGDMNIVTAILRGRLKVEGDPLLALRIAGSMPELGKNPAYAKRTSGGRS